MDISLLFELFQRMTLAATLAFVLSQTKLFRRIVYRQSQWQDKLLVSAAFGAIGIFGTYAGIPIDDALANFRVVGVMAAGFVGGPVVGLLTGMIAGGHRYFLGGFTAFSCTLSSICEGILAGLIYQLYPRKPLPLWVAFVGGFLGEAMQMGIILLTATPYELAAKLVGEIAVPMTIVNGTGVAIFMVIIKTAMTVQDKIGAEKSQKALNIAAKTLPYLRRGLNSESALATAKIIYEAADYNAVAVTDTEQVLAYVGAEADHHAPHLSKLTQITRKALTTGAPIVAQEKSEIGCSRPQCKLASAVVVPLVQAGEVIGTLKLYYTAERAVVHSDIVFAEGLAQLFSTQLELTEIDRQAKLASRSELKALYAQINPHFFFNTLNTITSLVRTKPEQARGLLANLAALFRFTLHKTGKMIPIVEEIAQVESYLTIEQARHGDKLLVVKEIDHHSDHYLIPSLSIQPLVENAIKHGLQPKEAGGKIILRVRMLSDDVIVEIIDDGVGMDLTIVNPLEESASEAIGLVNVHERLRGLYGHKYGIQLESEVGIGTTVRMYFPKCLDKEVEDCA
ncbi:MAG: sensor histidine kinase [Sporomusaceae bacterium]|nr:sensor histidine kinase [Sporomusaceae bacterium]